MRRATAAGFVTFLLCLSACDVAPPSSENVAQPGLPLPATRSEEGLLITGTPPMFSPDELMRASAQAMRRNEESDIEFWNVVLEGNAVNDVDDLLEDANRRAPGLGIAEGHRAFRAKFVGWVGPAQTDSAASQDFHVTQVLSVEPCSIGLAHAHACFVSPPPPR